MGQLCQWWQPQRSAIITKSSFLASITQLVFLSVIVLFYHLCEVISDASHRMEALFMWRLLFSSINPVLFQFLSHIISSLISLWCIRQWIISVMLDLFRWSYWLHSSTGTHLSTNDKPLTPPPLSSPLSLALLPLLALSWNGQLLMLAYGFNALFSFANYMVLLSMFFSSSLLLLILLSFLSFHYNCYCSYYLDQHSYFCGCWYL